MKNIKYFLSLFIVSLIIAGCGTKKTPTVNVVVQTPKSPVESVYPYPYAFEPTPATQVDQAYPGPSTGQQVPEAAYTPEYHVTNLVIPTPGSGKGVVTGQLLIGGEADHPYLATLFLASTIPPSTPDYPPMISYSEEDDPIAVQDVNTGRFLFSDVAPGQYAIIIWSPLGGFPLEDKDGTSVLFTVNAGEVKDLGILPIK